MDVPLAVDLNSPGRYLTWSIFTVSVANLVLIAVMVAIFGAALLLPFPGRRKLDAAYQAAPVAAEPDTSPGTDAGLDDDADMWTSKVRRLGLRLLPPGKLLPDRQPAYVASWVYVFGVATLAALGMAIVSGFAIALGGTDWWHTNPVGHFFNSLHLWSVELFMAFMVIHLWGKFWMAAWRGRRALTWITGVVAFVASVVECFTGYLSQQNFDSQWISTSGKDAFNAVGVGAFFNLMNFGQMLLWHVVLIPIVLVALVGAHVLLVRVRGVAHPLPGSRPSFRRPATPARRLAERAADAAAWRGPTRRYDILKEAAIAALVAARPGRRRWPALLSSPDVPPVTVAVVGASRARRLPRHRGQRAGRHERDRHLRPAVQHQPAAPQSSSSRPRSIAGVRQPIDAAQTFVLAPLAKTAPTDPRSPRRSAPTPRLARASRPVGRRLRQGRHQGHVRQRHARRARRPPTAPCRHAGRPS